jgi:hypothetical protein
MMHEMIATSLMDKNWLSFFVVEDILLEDNEDMLEKDMIF